MKMKPSAIRTHVALSDAHSEQDVGDLANLTEKFSIGDVLGVSGLIANGTKSKARRKRPQKISTRRPSRIVAKKLLHSRFPNDGSLRSCVSRVLRNSAHSIRKFTHSVRVLVGPAFNTVVTGVQF